MKQNESDIKAILSISNTGGSGVYFALFSGVLLFLSFPKFGLGLTALMAFVPLFIALRKVENIWRAFFLGWIAGLTACVGVIYWITYVVVNYGYLPVYLGVTIMILLACYLSLYFAVFAAGIVYLRRKIPLIFVAPVLWICLEYLKSHLFTGFPWENLGHSQFSNIFFIQIADITGVWGISFLIIVLNVALFEIIKERSKKSLVLAAVVLLLWSGAFTYGVMRINQIEAMLKDAPGLDVSLIQGNIDQSIKWNQEYQKETINIYEELSLRHQTQPEGLTVWPETAIPFNFQEEGSLTHQVKMLPVKTNNWFLFGSTSYRELKERVDYFNSAYLLSPHGDIHGRYDKVHLVPYGEYVPLRAIFPFISKLTEGIGDFARGQGFYPLTMGERRIGVLICYEGILPEAARTYKNADADLLVNITNDAWFGKTSAPYQHLSMSIFRVVETRLYLVRAANTGISAFVDPTGKIVAQTEIFKRDAIHGRVKFINVPTFYAKYGDWLVWSAYICLIIFFLWMWKGRLKNVIRKYSGSNS